jgi:tight adherence protein B
MAEQDALADVAATAHRLAVLLAAGVAPLTAWRYVAERSGSAVPRAIDGDPPADLLRASADRPPLEAQAWRGLAAAWSVAGDAGAPLAPALRAYAGSLRSLAQTQRDARTALAGPVATGRIVMALPVVGVLFGVALGFDTVGTLLGSPVGWACAAVGGALIGAGALWNRRLVAAARPTDAAPGVDCDLTAIAVSGGAALPRARAAVAAALERFALPASGRVEEVLALAVRAGVPAAELLRAEADEARADARADAQAKAAKLGVRLMLPLGVCVLPSFMVLGVLPLIASIVTSTVSGF